MAFAGWDFKVAGDGTYWCLEVNPVPAYDRRLGGAISASLLGLLRGGPPVIDSLTVLTGANSAALRDAVHSLLIHSGRTLHQVAPSTRVEPGDERLTLQGHDVWCCCTGDVGDEANYWPRKRSSSGDGGDGEDRVRVGHRHGRPGRTSLLRQRRTGLPHRHPVSRPPRSASGDRLREHGRVARR
ncbi:hypothetical protein [Streptomyces sp. NPDC001340]